MTEGDLVSSEGAKICIALPEYLRLIDADEMLHCLREAGVDSWEGYDRALALYGEEEEE